MVYSQATLDRTFAALADPTRRAILARLASGETAISELARDFPISLPAVSKHVRVLERAGLARIQRHGRVRRCRFVGAPLRGAAEWVERYRRFWDQHLDSLAEYLGEPSERREESSWPRQRRNRPRTASKSGAPSPRRRSDSSGRGRRRRS
ncbi:MAG TPA: metalloregulator ArsR/SmtB family transcription factor [Gemmatimonadaceae bacterium]|nr:metalloregulator ArsR/SmtB family transcription factor [Gemmatimonadaceae bacterium]